ncbi:alpha-glucosidase family 31 of glycosyl hydrolases [Jejuia pallidilutea]|nr:alpha-glucosidase family 31 of glycosyl hydrolases [Jejuia pallidilutea]
MVYEDATDGYDYIKGRYSLRSFKLSGKKKELIIQQHKTGKFITTYKTFKLNLHGLPFKITKVQVDNVDIPLKDLKINGDNTLVLTKEFNELHIIG